MIIRWARALDKPVYKFFTVSLVISSKFVTIITVFSNPLNLLIESKVIQFSLDLSK